MLIKDVKYIFWGSGPLAESVLFKLYEEGLIPSLVITTPDKKSGRSLMLKQNMIASWCESKNIEYLQPVSLKEIDVKSSPIFKEEFILSIVASYPKILREEILNLPKMGSLNIHPSKLPKYRGPSPVQTALLNGDTSTAVTIIKLDKEVDHGPILAQQEVEILDEDTNQNLENKLGTIGAELMLDILLPYLKGNLKTLEQDHSKATFTNKFEKKDGEIKLTDSAEDLQNKYKALLPHISIFFIINHKDKETRIKISKINLEKNFTKDKFAKDIILKVIPEGKSEMNFIDFERGYLK